VDEIVGTALLSERYRLVVESVIARLPADWLLVRGQPPKRVTFVEPLSHQWSLRGWQQQNSRRIAHTVGR
jgi:hypothetical protein